MNLGMPPFDPQHQLVDDLCKPSAYPHRPKRVEHLQTPLSHIFIAPPYAYKLKKPVTLSFVDFATEERRHAICEDEVVLNRRLCPSIYLGVVPIARNLKGEFEVDGRGDAVEHLVWMRALPASGMLPVALKAGRVTAETLRGFGRTLADFHASASGEQAGQSAESSPEALRKRWDDVLANCEPAIGTLLSPSNREILADVGPTFLTTHHELLERRVRDGRICEGHGDLHAGNLCLVEHRLPAISAEAPAVESGLYAFDCIEFSESLRWNDVASEVAFLAMDLEVRHHDALAEAFVSAYLQRSGDQNLRQLLGYYKIHRACVRGMVHAQTAGDEAMTGDLRNRAAWRAVDFFAYAAREAWHSNGRMLVAFTGLSGTGKTALAALVAERTGFAHLSSDEVRKRAVGLDPLSATPPERTEALYGPEGRGRVYDQLAREATEQLRAGQSVIADATFLLRSDRNRLEEVARREGVSLLFVECTADPEIVRARLETRAKDAVPRTHQARSDADWHVYQQQVFHAEPLCDDEPALRVATGRRPLPQLLEDTIVRLWKWRAEAQMPATTIPSVTRLAATNDQPT